MQCAQKWTQRQILLGKNTILSKNCKLFAKKYTKYLTFPKTNKVFSQLKLTLLSP